MSIFPPGPHVLPGCILRPLTPEDAPDCARFLAEIDPFRSLGYGEAALSGYLKRTDPALSRFVIAEGDQLLGIVALRHPWLRGPFLELLALRPAAQGRGLGRQVLTWARNQASGNLWATVSAFNAGARRFYARLGFEEVALLPDLVKPGQEEVLLRVRL